MNVYMNTDRAVRTKCEGQTTSMKRSDTSQGSNRYVAWKYDAPMEASRERADGRDKDSEPSGVSEGFQDTHWPEFCGPLIFTLFKPTLSGVKNYLSKS